jgi:hypothetical protein
MEPEGSLPYSQVPATCPYPEPPPGNTRSFFLARNEAASSPRNMTFINSSKTSVTNQRAMQPQISDNGAVHFLIIIHAEYSNLAEGRLTEQRLASVNTANARPIQES